MKKLFDKNDIQKVSHALVSPAEDHTKAEAMLVSQPFFREKGVMVKLLVGLMRMCVETNFSLLLAYDRRAQTMVIGQRNRCEREKIRSIGEGRGLFRDEVEKHSSLLRMQRVIRDRKIVTEMMRRDSSTSDIFLDKNKSHKRRGGRGGLAMKAMNVEGEGRDKDYELMVSAFLGGMKSVIFDANCDMRTDEGTLSM